METICSQGGHDALTRLGCFVYDFQTLITGLLAIGVGIIAGIPVWRQLKDTNLQTRISHRETLATLLRDAVSRFSRVDQAMREPLSTAFRVTYGPDGEPMEINPHDAHYLEQAFHGVLDWYLVVLTDTEHADIEARKSALKGELNRLCDTLSDAHWADHNVISRMRITSSRMKPGRKSSRDALRPRSRRQIASVMSSRLTASSRPLSRRGCDRSVHRSQS